MADGNELLYLIHYASGRSQWWRQNFNLNTSEILPVICCNQGSIQEFRLGKFNIKYNFKSLVDRII